jgi:hypothetical protein
MKFKLRQLLLLMVLVAPGCGPVQSTYLIMKADVQVEGARAADASRLSPYEFTAAVAYLHKAREETGYADYEVAVDFAQKAAKYAQEAKEKSMAAAAEGALPSVPGATPPPMPVPPQTPPSGIPPPPPPPSPNY